jgi:hypothetical protein
LQKEKLRERLRVTKKVILKLTGRQREKLRDFQRVKLKLRDLQMEKHLVTRLDSHLGLLTAKLKRLEIEMVKLMDSLKGLQMQTDSLKGLQRDLQRVIPMDSLKEMLRLKDFEKGLQKVRLRVKYLPRGTGLDSHSERHSVIPRDFQKATQMQTVTLRVRQRVTQKGRLMLTGLQMGLQKVKLKVKPKGSHLD